jgi:hypothetical protein
MTHPLLWNDRPQVAEGGGRVSTLSGDGSKSAAFLPFPFSHLALP